MRQAVIIGLDGLSWNVLSILINRDVVPNINFLRRGGASSELRTIIPPVTIPAWTSLASGVNPGKHGVYSFTMPTRDYGSRLTTYKDVKYPRIHEILTLEGLSSVVINLPLSYPPLTHNGIMISDWLYPKLETFPSTAQDMTLNYLPMDHRWFESQNTSDYIQSLFEGLSSRLIAIKECFSKTKWNLFFVVFSETDFLLHKIYDDIISGRGYAREAYKIFKMIDEFIGWAVKNTKDDSIILLVSDHGFDKYEYFININEILSQKGIIKFPIINRKEPSQKTSGYYLSNKKVIHVPKFIYSRIMKTKFRKEARLIFRTLFGSDAVSSYKRGYDFCSSSAFMFNSTHFGIYINTKDLFNNGLIQEDEVPKIMQSLINLLNNMKNFETKEKIFKRIYSREDIFQGPYTREFPHIILLPKKRYWLHHGMAEKIIAKKSNINHSLMGIFIAYGENIANKDNLKNLSILDIAPTTLQYLKLPIPNDTDGKVLLDIFKEGSDVRERPIRKVNYLERWSIIRKTKLLSTKSH